MNARQRFKFAVERYTSLGYKRGRVVKRTVEMRSEPRTESRFTQVQEEVIVCEGFDIVDEVVVGDWLHLAAVDERIYLLDVAGVTLCIRLREDGTVKKVTVHGPEHAGPVDRVKYVVDWA